MGIISSSVGLASGFPIASTVSALISIAAQPRNALQTATNNLQTQQSAYTAISAQLIQLQLSTVALSHASEYNSTTATSSNPSALSVTTTGTPAVGTYQFTP